MSRQSKRPVVPRALPFVVLMALGGLAQPAAGQSVNGWSVTWAQAGQGRSKVSEFRQIGDRAWREVPSSGSGNTFDFTETGRDDASVSLHDPSRNVEIRIDLAARKVYYSDANTSSRELYDVLSSSARANGWLVRHVSYGQGGRTLGELCQTGDRTWREDNDANTFTFTETGRDDASVSLRDSSRGVEIEINLDAGKIYYRDANTSWRELYDVLSSSAKANGWLVRRVGYGQGGRSLGELHQTGDRTWREVQWSSSGTTFDFTETGRDDASVYLHDPSRDVELEIDLGAGKIYYRDAKTPWRELYDVHGASL